MEEFLDFIYENKQGKNPYETKRYVSFSQLEKAGYSKTDIFNYITEANKKGLIYAGNDIFGERRVALSSKGKFYVEHITKKVVN